MNNNKKNKVANFPHPRPPSAPAGQFIRVGDHMFCKADISAFTRSVVSKQFTVWLKSGVEVETSSLSGEEFKKASAMLGFNIGG